MKTNRESYFFDMIRSELEDIVGPEDISQSPVDKLAHAVDYYWVAELWHDRGQKTPQADFIVYPQTTQEVSRILKIANTYKIPVTPWGGGSGSQGGALPVCGGIVMDMKKICVLHEVNKTAMTVTVDTGINMQQLEWELEKKGGSTMHLPASITCATLGGFIAHRGTGVLSTKYGKIEDMIISMEVVLPDGRIINTLPVPRHASGPDLNQVFLGSEGTLGVVTRATLKIHPIPEVRKFQAFLFPDLRQGLEAGKNIMCKRLRPCVIRLYDEAETQRLIKRVLGIDRQGAYLVFGFDGDEDMVDLEMKSAVRLCDEMKGENLGTEMGQEWWNHRYKFFFPPYMFHMPQAFGTLDTVATFDKIGNVYTAMKKTIETNFPEATYIGHFSHWYDWGCMLYARFIIDNPPADPHEALALYNRIWNLALRASMENGGVLNEHHGIGLKLGRLMKELHGEAFFALEAIKKSLDPNNIMNPGKMGLGIN
ncbi:MAG: FAD-binding oxidoreductase [Verrucomicrobiae bacterium]|nr:FAD-binding oxidoreductase [Verrucomicrobiae bacterium]